MSDPQPRDVMADRIETWTDERPYDFADRLITDLDKAGFEIVPSDEVGESPEYVARLERQVPEWHEFNPEDQSTYPPTKDFYWATWKNGRVEQQHFDLDSAFVDMLWRHCTHWAPIVPPISPNPVKE